MLKHKVRESEKRTERSESYTVDVGEYHVFMDVREDGFVTVGLLPIAWDRMRLPLLSIHPKCVGDLEQLANVLPDILRGFAVELRAAGKDDLRSQIDRDLDKWDTEREALVSRYRSQASHGAEPTDQ